MTLERPDGFALVAEPAGTVVVHQRWTRYWTVVRGDACVRRAGAWTAVEVRGAGSVEVRARFSAPARSGVERRAPHEAAGETSTRPDPRAAAGRIRLVRAQAFAARFLPKGWWDLVRQLALFGGAYILYRIARGPVDERAAQAFANARELGGIGQTLGLFLEPAVHAWAGSKAWMIDVSSWMYVNSHFTVTALTLAWIYLFRNSAFDFVRNTANHWWLDALFGACTAAVSAWAATQLVRTRPQPWAFRFAPHGAPA